MAREAEILHDALAHGRWEEQVDALAARFAATAPTPHIVLDDLLPPGVASTLERLVPDLDAEGWTHYKHVNEHKQVWSRREGLPEPLLAILDELNGERFRDWLSRVTGVPGLLPDSDFRAGGGLSACGRGGFLNVHRDFTDHPFRRSWRRRVNLILYLNEHWEEGWGGQTELWDAEVDRVVASVTPKQNRCLVFDSVQCFHGHPEPTRCPPDTARLTLALYYFTEEEGAVSASTSYRPRPVDGPLKRVMIRLDVWMVRVYHWMKRRFRLSDTVVSRVLESLARLRARFSRRA